MGLPSVDFFNPPDTYETPALADCEKCGERVLYCLETRERQERIFGRLPLVCQKLRPQGRRGYPDDFCFVGPGGLEKNQWPPHRVEPGGGRTIRLWHRSK